MSESQSECHGADVTGRLMYDAMKKREEEGKSLITWIFEEDYYKMWVCTKCYKPCEVRKEEEDET